MKGELSRTARRRIKDEKKKNDKEKKERETEREKKRIKRTGIVDENRKEKTQNKLNVKIKLPEKKEHFTRPN